MVTAVEVSTGGPPSPAPCGTSGLAGLAHTRAALDAPGGSGVLGDDPSVITVLAALRAQTPSRWQASPRAALFIGADVLVARRGLLKRCDISAVGDGLPRYRW
jgi:hypothetical protein